MNEWQPSPNSFAEEVLQRGHFLIDDIFQEMDELSKENLELLVVLKLMAILGDFPNPTAESLWIAVSFEVLYYFLGVECTQSLILPNVVASSKELRDGRVFLHADASSVDDRFIYQNRVTNLAECLYNLQGIPGYRERLKRLPFDNLEAAMAELECVKLLSAPIFRLSFVTPRGLLGADYDCEFTTTWGRVVCAEIKRKEDGTSYENSTVYNTLEHARRQLPKDRPGLVFLRIPEHWARQSECKIVIDNAIAKVFRQSNRLVAVVIVIEQCVKIGEVRIFQSGFAPTFNLRSSFYASDIEYAFNMATQLRKANWISFGPFIALRLKPMIAFVQQNFRLKPNH